MPSSRGCLWFLLWKFSPLVSLKEKIMQLCASLQRKMLEDITQCVVFVFFFVCFFFPSAPSSLWESAMAVCSPVTAVLWLLLSAGWCISPSALFGKETSAKCVWRCWLAGFLWKASREEPNCFLCALLQAEHALIVISGRAYSALQWSALYTKYEWLHMLDEKVNRSEYVLGCVFIAHWHQQELHTSEGTFSLCSKWKKHVP